MVLEGQFNPHDALTQRTGKLLFGDVSTNWCLPPPEWRGNRLYVAYSDNGFTVLTDSQWRETDRTEETIEHMPGRS